jgi:hypothetical protein
MAYGVLLISIHLGRLKGRWVTFIYHQNEKLIRIREKKFRQGFDKEKEFFVERLDH